MMEVDLHHYHDNASVHEIYEVINGVPEKVWLVESAIDVEDYYPSVGWDLMGVPGLECGRHNSPSTINSKFKSFFQAEGIKSILKAPELTMWTSLIMSTSVEKLFFTRLI